MKINTQANQEIEKKETSTNLTLPEELIDEKNMNMPFSNVLGMQMEGKENFISSLSSLPNIDFMYDTLNMSLEDARFFINLAQEGQFTVNTTEQGTFNSLIQTNIAQNTVMQKTVEVTNQLTTLIEKAQSTQKPVRIAFDNDISVILRIDKNGKVTAEFIPGSIEAENFLRNNISSLRQKFDEQNLPYNDLLYRQNNGKQNNKKRNQNKGEE